MGDVFSRQKRSWVMRQVRGADTRPELLVRRWLHRQGFRYRLQGGGLPGRPDIVLSSRRAAVFVHGCFWHAHPGCKHSALPASNRDYWERKIGRNVTRDRRNSRLLRRSGWRVFVVWECRIRRAGTLTRLANALRKQAARR